MCDTFVALGNSTKDGSVYFAKNSDREPNEAHEIVIYPATEHQPGEMVKCTYIEIPQVEKTHRVLLAKPFWIWGAEMGSNEYGVTIGNEAVFTRVPYQKEPGLIGMDYLRLALERSTTSDEAVAVITDLLEQYGQSGNCGYTHPFYYHNSFLICDRHTAWVLETAGRHWVAERVKDVRSISNALTIEDHWDLASADLVDHAIQKGWCKNRKDFSFSSCYTEPVYTFFGDGRKRQQLTECILQGNKGKIDAALMMKILRNHSRYESQEWSPDRGVLGADVCMHASWGPARASQSVGSLVSRISPQGDCHWVTGTSAPCLSNFKPIWMDTDLSSFGLRPGGEYDPSTLYWRHEMVHRGILEDYAERAGHYIWQREILEGSFIDQVEAIAAAGREERQIFSQSCFDNDELLDNEMLSELDGHPVSNKNGIIFQNFWNKINQSAKMNN